MLLSPESVVSTIVWDSLVSLRLVSSKSLVWKVAVDESMYSSIVSASPLSTTTESLPAPLPHFVKKRTPVPSNSSVTVAPTFEVLMCAPPFEADSVSLTNCVAMSVPIGRLSSASSAWTLVTISCL